MGDEEDVDDETLDEADGVDGGTKLEPDEDELFRQVHPAFIHEGRVGSRAFRPTEKDEWLLSVARSTLTTADEAYKLYTEGRQLASIGVWGVTVQECLNLKLPSLADPITEPVEDAAHAVVDFRGKSKNEVERLSKKLAAIAQARGCRHPKD